MEEKAGIEVNLRITFGGETDLSVLSLRLGTGNTLLLGG